MRCTSLAARGGGGAGVADPTGYAVADAGALDAPASRSGSTYGRISSPSRLILIKCNGVMLSDVPALTFTSSVIPGTERSEGARNP